MNLFSIFSDDQTAIIGCFGAMAVCGLIVALSFKFGPSGRDRASETRTIRLKSVRPDAAADARERRAA